MLRRASTSLRHLLLVLCIVIIAWLPFTWRYTVALALPWPGDYTCILISQGAIGTQSYENKPPSSVRNNFGFTVRRKESQVSYWTRSAWYRPEFERSRYPIQMPDQPGVTVWRSEAGGAVPIGLLAALCLVWPVASLISAHRRRRLRGFPVIGTDN